MLMFDHQFEAI